MYTSDCLGNDNGMLTIGGVRVDNLVKEYGTPLYVLDEDTVRNNIRNFKKSLDENYEKGMVLYASKALNCLELCRIANDEGIGLDCVSAGEI